MRFLRALLLAATSFIALIDLYRCVSETEGQREERIARQACSSCHVFPEAHLLTKKIWHNDVLPEMAFRMGLSPGRPAPSVDGVALGVIPKTPMVSIESWQLIQKYFERMAPDSLPGTSASPTHPLDQFTVSEIRVNHELPQFCLAQVDPKTGQVFSGNRNSKLYSFNKRLILADSFDLPSPPSHILFESNGSMLISTMGIMDPNDERKGRIVELDSHTRKITTLVDRLQRPVYFEKCDLNRDDREDLVVCEFGNYTGGLQAYENAGNGKFIKHTMLGLPGARKVVVRDVNNDGKPDVVALFTQGNEEIVLFRNIGNFKFEMQPLLQFSPVNGSSFFELLDYNGDGLDDIIYTNGDNFDFSPILKPYHGVHLFINLGNYKFNEYLFAPLNGASMAAARDFDGDGDTDIAAISFFPDFEKAPERSFVYYEKTGKVFNTHTTPRAVDGRWIVMDTGDVDHDGDQDIVLAALDFKGATRVQFQTWVDKRIGLMVLRNNRIR